MLDMGREKSLLPNLSRFYNRDRFLLYNVFCLLKSSVHTFFFWLELSCTLHILTLHLKTSNIFGTSGSMNNEKGCDSFLETSRILTKFPTIFTPLGGTFSHEYDSFITNNKKDMIKSILRKMLCPNNKLWCNIFFRYSGILSWP